MQEAAVVETERETQATRAAITTALKAVYANRKGNRPGGDDRLRAARGQSIAAEQASCCSRGGKEIRVPRGRS